MSDESKIHTPEPSPEGKQGGQDVPVTRPPLDFGDVTEPNAEDCVLYKIEKILGDASAAVDKSVLPTGNVALDETADGISEPVTEPPAAEPTIEQSPPPPFLQEAGRVKDRKSRMVVVETVYHQVSGEGPQSFQSRYTRWVGTDEQTYTRRTKAGPEWKPLEFGWVESACQVTVSNLSKSYTDMILTPEQVEELETHLLIVGVSVDVARSENGQGTMWSRHPSQQVVVAEFLIVYPGESCRFEPCDGQKYMVRACSEGVPYVVNAVPN